MGAIGTFLTAAGSGVTAAGQIASGRAAQDIYDYNATLAEYEAQYQQQRAGIEQQLLEEDVERVISRQRALAGASGTVGGTGSNLAVIKDTARQGAIDASLIRYQANVNAWRARNQARLLSAQGEQARFAGNLQGATTLLSGASRFDFGGFSRPSTSLIRPAVSQNLRWRNP